MVRPALRLAALVALAFTSSAAAGCTTAADCSYGGACVDGACACRPTWTGANCSQLALLPAATGVAFHPPNTSSWGGSVVASASGVYWMALAEMLGHCGLSSWESNSGIRLASAAAAQGPYAPGPLLLPAFAHNPTLHRTRNGSLVIAHIGEGVPYKPFIDTCTNGTTGGGPTGASAAAPPPLRLGVKGAPLPAPNFLFLESGEPGDGSPWIAINSSGGAWAENNPALYLASEDGSALLVYKTGCACPGGCFCREFGVATAPSWQGPYTDGGLINVFGEDAYIWRDAPTDGAAFHMLFQGGSYAPQYPQYVGHWHTAFSADGLTWTVAADSEVFNATISLGSGGALSLERRERHQLLFDPATGAPTALFNGVNLAGARNDSTFTAVQPIATAAPR